MAICSAQAGEQLDRFQLESVVAHSGMATIFRARDLETGQQVAIKLPHLEVESDPVFFDRFRREEGDWSVPGSPRHRQSALR